MLVQKIYSVSPVINSVNKTNDSDEKKNCANISPLTGSAKIPAFAIYFTGVYPRGSLEKVYQERFQIFAHVRTYLSGTDRSAVKIEELVDKLGQIKLVAIDKNDKETIKSVDRIAKKLFPNSENINLETYIRGLKALLEKAISTNQNIVFVKGHKNPDIDSIISSILEAYRNSCIDKKSVYIPVVDGNYLGGDVQYLLSKREQKSLIYTGSEIYKQASANPNTKWIFVDHNKELPLQNRVIKIIDHHHLADEAKNPDIPITAEKTGSAAALVAIKILGSGIEVSHKVARLLYGTALRDTENYKPKKITEKDSFVMKFLREKTHFEEGFYGNMMRAFIKAPKTPEQLFYENYKQDGFGFAVCETSEFFKHGSHSEGYDKCVKGLLSVAQQNNHDQNLPFTLVHLQDFASHCEHIQDQRIYLIVNNSLIGKQQSEIFGKVMAVVRDLAHGDAKISVNLEEKFIDIRHSHEKISRNKTSRKLREALAQ